MQTIAILPELTNAPNLHQVCNHNLMASLKLNWKRIFSDRSDCFSNAISSPRALTMHPKYAIVAARANRACEYCDAPEVISNFAFEVDHTTPISKAGSDDFDDLALSCRIFNLRKSDHTDAIDPLTQTVVPLFNPRRQNWSEHFEKLPRSPYEIIGKPPIGRATVLRLNLNSSLQLCAREFWVALGIFSLD
jgi:hypothetical protein